MRRACPQERVTLKNFGMAAEFFFHGWIQVAGSLYLMVIVDESHRCFVLCLDESGPGRSIKADESLLPRAFRQRARHEVLDRSITSLLNVDQHNIAQCDAQPKVRRRVCEYVLSGDWLVKIADQHVELPIVKKLFIVTCRMARSTGVVSRCRSGIITYFRPTGIEWFVWLGA